MKTSASALRATLVALFIGSVPSVALGFTVVEALSADLLETHNDIARAGNQLQNAVKALRTLVEETGDLKPGFQTFTNAIGGTEVAAKTTRDRAKKLTDNMTTYFSKWQVEVDAVEDSATKATAQQRLTTVQRSYSKLVADTTKAAEKFRTLGGQLNEIQSALTNDLTQSRLYSGRDLSDSAQESMASLHNDLQAILNQIIEMRNVLTASAGR